MSRKQRRNGRGAYLDSSDFEKLIRADSLIKDVAKKHDLNFNEVIDKILNLENEINIPLSVFRSDVGPLEAVVLYLHDIIGISFVKISRLLSRNENTIWTTYNNASKKKFQLQEITDIDFKKWKIPENLSIPISVLLKTKLSILESVGVYLMDEIGLSYSKISKLLQRDDRTIWTVINRARKK